MSKYKAIVTTSGAAKIAAASAGGKQLKITHMAVGDGNGVLPTPNPAQTKLINEKYRALLNTLTVDKSIDNHIIAEFIIPANVGGFWLREAGLYDDAGVLIAVSNMAESYKPKLEEGSGRTQTLRMVLIVSSTEAIQLIAGGDTVLATRDFVDDAIKAHEKTRNHPDASTTTKGLVQLSSATDSNDEIKAATPKAVKAINDASVKKAANLADLTDKGKARGNLGLGTAATKNVGTTKGQVMEVGAGGLLMGARHRDDVYTNDGQIFRADVKSANKPPMNSTAGVISLPADGGPSTGYVAVSPANGAGWIGSSNKAENGVRWSRIYTTDNKPSASDVNAYSKAESDKRFVKLAGDTLTGPLALPRLVYSGEVSTDADNDLKRPDGFVLEQLAEQSKNYPLTQGKLGNLITFKTNKYRHVQFAIGSGNTEFWLRSLREDQPDTKKNWARVYTTQFKPSPDDIGAYSKGESDGRYFARGTTATTKNVAWNAATGVYNTQEDGMTMVVHFAAGGTGSTRAADFRFNFGNGGLAYRSSRDGFGYENGWTKVYTDRQRPTAAEVQAADVRNNFAAKMGANRTLSGDAKPTAPGVWSVENSKWAPEGWGTMLYTTNRPDLKADTGNGQFHHYLFLSHNRKLWVATNVNGNWSGWQAMYSTTNKPTAADVGALPLTGGNLTGPVSSTSWLSATALTATYHTTTAGNAPEGSGAFSAQLDSKAPFYQANFDWDVTSGGHYVPLVKGRSNRKGQGYPTAVSFGYLLDGSGSFARPCIHARGDNNKDAVWQFNPNDNMLYAPGPIKAGGATLATDGNIMGSRWGNKWLWDAVIEQVNGRVDWGAYNRDVGARATIDYVNQNFVRDIRLASRGEITTDGALTEAPWGAVITGGNGNEGNQVGIMLYRYLQKNVNGNWYTVAYA